MKEHKIGFFDVETLHGFNGAVGLVGFKYLDENYYPFKSSGQFYSFLHNESLTKKITLYGFNSSRFDLLKVLDESYAYGAKMEIMDIKLSGTLPFSISIRFPDIHTIIKFKDLRGVFRAGSLNSLSKDILGLEKLKDIDVRNLEKITPEVVEYNKRDVALTQKLYEYIVNFFGSTKVSTAPGMSMRMFEASYGEENVAKKINRRGTRMSYYGGRTEVFKRRVNEPFTYYDINSLYPFCMANNPFPVGPVYGGEKCISKDGFALAKVRISDNYIPFAPVKMFNKLLFPSGCVHGVWTNFELRKMISLGYDVSILNSYVCDESEYLFEDFIKKIYRKRVDAKKSGNKAMDVFCKLVMNSVYGKFGKKREIEVIQLKTIENIEKTIPYVNKMFLGDTLYFWTIRRICPKSVYYDYIVASYITAYGRSTLFDFAMKAGEKNLIYVDTDSIMSFGSTLDNYVSDELGGMKKERNCLEGSFMAPKMYALYTSDGKKEFRAKGLSLPEIKKESWMSDDEYTKISNEHERIYSSIRMLQPFSMQKTRIYGIKESMRRHSNTFFNIENDSPKEISSVYDKRVILDDGSETKPLRIDISLNDLRGKLKDDVFFRGRCVA